LHQLACRADERLPSQALLETARHLDADVAQEIDIVIERERVGVVRQRERLAAERHRLPEGGTELVGITGLQISRQIDQSAGAGIAADLLVLDPEDVRGLSPRQAGVDQLIELHRITVDLQPDRHVGMQRLIFVDDRLERVFFGLRSPYRQGQGDRRLRMGPPPKPRRGECRRSNPARKQPAPPDTGEAACAINGHIPPE
jgi:hypothetical protein